MKIAILLLALRIIWPPDIAKSTGAKCRQIETTDADGCESHMVKGAATWWRVCGYVQFGDDEKVVLIRSVDSPLKASDVCHDFARAYYRRMDEVLKTKQ